MTKSLAELQQGAKTLLEKYGVKKLYATSDGQYFLLESRANLHAGKNMTVYTIQADEAEVPASAAGTGPVKNTLSVKALTDLIEQETDLAVLNTLLLEEVGGPNRASAVKAIEKRIAEVTHE